MPLDEVKISPLDRGFLFGEGIYEVVPCYDNRLIAWDLHVERLWQGLDVLEIKPDFDPQQLRLWCEELVQKNGQVDQALYIHITRGDESRRFHGWQNNAETTAFLMSNPIPSLLAPEKHTVKPLEVSIERDHRWRNCHIKSTSLLGNVMHFQSARQGGHDEVLLMDDKGYVTEASTSNYFIVKGNTVVTPPLSHALLPGVTRRVILSILRRYSDYKIMENNITLEQLLDADEVWLTSSSKGVAPVVRVEEHVIGDGKPGDSWLVASQLYSNHIFDY